MQTTYIVVKKWYGGKITQVSNLSFEAAINDKSKGKTDFKQVEGTLLFKLIFKCENKIFLNFICFRREDRNSS